MDWFRCLVSFLLPFKPGLFLLRTSFLQFFRLVWIRSLRLVHRACFGLGNLLLHLLQLLSVNSQDRDGLGNTLMLKTDILVQGSSC